MSPRARFGITVAILLVVYALALLYASAARAEPPKGTEVAAMSDRYIFRITAKPCTNAVITAELARQLPQIQAEIPGIVVPKLAQFMAGSMDYEGQHYESCWAEIEGPRGTFVMQMADDKGWIKLLPRDMFRSQGI